jgi:outer membrane protein assembly factor BamD
MPIKIFIFIVSTIFLISCSKENPDYQLKPKEDPYKIYNEAYEAFEKGDYFYAQKKFLEVELSIEKVEVASKASIMASYSLYSINFYDEAIENLNKYLKKYPANKEAIYAEYLIAIIYFEQIKDETKDAEPINKAKQKIDNFLKKYPNTEYALDLKFKNDLIINQLAAKELYVAKYYISVQKWIPAINRLKVIVEKYDQTIFIEEALYRLVEINYFIGLKKEAEKYASILGYNYNSSEWHKQSYKILNKNYELLKKDKVKKKDNLIKKIINKIRFR